MYYVIVVEKESQAVVAAFDPADENVPNERYKELAAELVEEIAKYKVEDAEVVVDAEVVEETEEDDVQ